MKNYTATTDMSPEMIKFGIRMAREKAQKEVSFRKAYYCKNTTSTMSTEHKITPATKPEEESISFDVSSQGCKQPRRNNSAYCQECSDKHNKSW